ncbi:MAG: prephenate dehydratase [Candidatus Peribacteraceae bacterium]
MRIFTLGPAGTFSSEATQEIFPDADILYAANFDRLFQILEKAEDAIGVVPIENSLHGSVHNVLDLLYHSPVSIWRMHDLRIRHAIGAQDPKSIDRIASHPQALAQCRKYLLEHFPDAEHFPVSSTTYALDLAAADPSTAAIAREDAIREHELTILDTNIEGANNTTRFGIVAKDDPYPDLERSRMSIVLHPREDRSGLLHILITPFKVYDVNMTKLESRPTGEKIGDYYFFIDFEGKQSDARVQKIFEEIKEYADITILGIW